eukprot:5188_1
MIQACELRSCAHLYSFNSHLFSHLTSTHALINLMPTSKQKLLNKLQTKEGMLQASAVAALVVASTTICLFIYEIFKNKNATKPLGFKSVDKSKIRPIKNRSGDITKDRYHPSKTKLPQNIDYIVIGSGIGGLTTAGLLSRVGRRVLVLEQHDRLGGCLHQYNNAYQFDTGVHYIGKIFKYRKMLQPITSKDKKIQFVAMGNEQNGYLYDEYIFGKGDHIKSFKARANTRKQDLFDQFKSEKDRNALNTFFEYKKASESMALCVFAGKLLNSGWISRLLFKFAKYKYSLLWNKSAYDICTSLFSHNPLLAMSIFGLVGDMGGKLKDNAMMIIFGAFSHYQYGGYFINGGPSEITRSIIPVIEASGGRCLANVCVESIIFEHDRAVGVRCRAKKGNKMVEFRSKYGVISTAGFVNTYSKFAPVESLPSTVSTQTKSQIQRLLTTIKPSVQHFHIFIGFDKTARELDFPQNNRWYFQFEGEECDYDYDELLDNFHRDPLHAPTMGFLSFPSAKNPSFEQECPGKSSCVILTEIPHYHFVKWKDEQHDARGEDYVSLKEKIANRLIEELLFKFFPKCKGNIAKKDIGTALSASYYLGSSIGESYGLGHQCERYFDYELNQLLKPKQAVKGLWLGGQDLLCAGFASALQSGVWCAEAILGYHRLPVLLSGRNLVKDLNKMDGYTNDHKADRIQDYDFDRVYKQAYA